MTSAPWPAPRAQRPVDAIVPLPGSKSMTNRALVIAALARGRSVVRRPLRSRDTELMAAALRALGVSITEHGETPQSDQGEQSERSEQGEHGEQWFVSGVGGRPQVHAPSVDVGLAGTVARFLPAVAALADGSVEFDGDAQMRERPMAPLLHALRHLGVRVDAAAGDRLPWRVHGAGGVEGGGMRGGEVTVDASTSSQLVSGLLLAAPCFADGLVARHVGPPMPSRPHVDMTVAMMRSAGGQVEEPDRNTWVVRPGGYRACDVEIEPDLSGASAFLAAAVATGGTVVIPGWPATTTQPGQALLDLLGRLGATWTVGANSLVLTGPAQIAGIEADLRDCPEMTPAIAALAALASSPSRLTGVAHIRLQETDRIAALATELARLGADVDELPDGLVLRPAPAPMRGAVLRAYGDHRLAMAWAVLGLVVPGVSVDDVATTAKTMPDFVRRWTAMLSNSARS